LQSLMPEPPFSSEMDLIWKEVTLEICNDPGVALPPDNSVVDSAIPAFLTEDYMKMQQCRSMFPSRALAIAYKSIQREVSQKMKALALKKEADEDIQMMEAFDQSATVEALVDRKLKRLLSEGKISRQGPAVFLPTTKCGGGPARLTPLRCEKAPEKGPRCKAHPSHPRKRKREREEEVSRQMTLLDRAVAGRGRRVGHTAHTVVTRVSRSRTLENTTSACLFFEKHSNLSNSVSSEIRSSFVFRHSPVHIVEHHHEFAHGVFMGPGIVIPREIEYQLALNAKFILHKEPNPLRVHDAWNKLERSVRLRWHFRDSDSKPSKFYVSNREWQPPHFSRDFWIEKGLKLGKDLLLSQAAALPLGQDRRPNPSLTKIHEFLRSGQFLVKLTDKNLGLSVMTKTCYIQECEKLLADSSTYQELNREDVIWYIRQILIRITEFVQAEGATGPTAKYLSLSKHDTSIPTFHGLPKVHKKDWSLRPIIPSHSWVTKRCSELADFVLRQCIKEVLPWCVDSSRQVISLLHNESFIRSDSLWLCTGDVQSFYTNVPIKETSEAIRQVLGDQEHEGIKANMLHELLDMVMNANCFQFNTKYFRQVSGVAM
jgi:hypothetical protein